jgi:amino acid transporter
MAGPTLRRTVSLPLVTLYGLGNILGAGIYVLIGKVAGLAGYLTPTALLIAAFTAAFTALSYAELVSRFPSSAGVAAYLARAYGRPGLSLLVGFLIVVAVLVSAATLVNGFAGYLSVFVELPRWLVVPVIVTSLGLLAASGVAASLRVTALFTLVEAGGLVLIVIVAAGAFAELPEHASALVPPLEWPAWSGVLLAAFLAFYAYTGFEDMVTLAEEVERPERTMPIAILLALLISTLLYAAVALVAVLSVPPEALGASEAPLALVFEAATGSSPILIAVIGLFAVVNGALVQIIMPSRMLYGMSRHGWLPAWLGRINARTRTPVVATVLVSASVIMLALAFPLLHLAAATSFFLLLVFSLVNLALLRIKRTEPRPAGARVFPQWVPLIGLLSSLGLLLGQVLVLAG